MIGLDLVERSQPCSANQVLRPQLRQAGVARGAQACGPAGDRLTNGYPARATTSSRRLDSSSEFADSPGEHVVEADIARVCTSLGQVPSFPEVIPPARKRSRGYPSIRERSCRQASRPRDHPDRSTATPVLGPRPASAAPVRSHGAANRRSAVAEDAQERADGRVFTPVRPDEQKHGRIGGRSNSDNN